MFLACFAIIKLTDNYKSLENKSNSIKKDFSILAESGVSNKMGSGRIEIYKLCLNLLPHVPFLGCGVDALSFGLVKYTTNDYLNYLKNHKIYIDKAHCEPLHIACTIGIPAVFLYLLFIATIEFPLLEYSLQDVISFSFAIIIASYFIQALFNISTIGVAPLFWFTLGLSENYRLSKS